LEVPVRDLEIGMARSPVTSTRKAGPLAYNPVHYVTKHLQQRIESGHFRVKKNMPRIGDFQSFHTARCTVQGCRALLVAVSPKRGGSPGSI